MDIDVALHMSPMRIFLERGSLQQLSNKPSSQHRYIDTNINFKPIHSNVTPHRRRDSLERASVAAVSAARRDQSSVHSAETFGNQFGHWRCHYCMCC